MRFRKYDNLRSFREIGRHGSLGSAAKALNLTKGAVSHQVDTLESALGFRLLERRHSGISLTPEGSELLRVIDVAYASIEQTITRLRQGDGRSITIGMATYFASRWLSPRLMRFITAHPDTRLRIQPTVGTADLAANDIDMAIRWGKGDWVEPGLVVEKIFDCPAMVASDVKTGRAIRRAGIEKIVTSSNLLHDTDESKAWEDWFHAAGLTMPGNQDVLTIPDPNVRIQAVIDGQGIALYDGLANDEIMHGRLVFYEPVRLLQYGYYLLYPEGLPAGSAMITFRDWIMAEAANCSA